MTRAVHATTASGDAITLEASAELGARGRTTAQLEHNAMQALGLARASSHALQEAAQLLERAGLLLASSRVVVDPTIRPELRRVFTLLAERVSTASHAGQLLLRGGTVVYALEDPWQETSELASIDLPDLNESAELVSLELNNASLVNQRTSAFQAEVRKDQKRFAALSKSLCGALEKLHRGRTKNPHATARVQDDGFVALIGRVRDHVLDSGSSALQVQGAPSTRAAWLVEALEK
jgi:hypothetical protein